MYCPSILAASARWILVAMCLAGAASCQRGEPEPLRISIIPWPGYEVLFLADELRYFDAEGVDVQLVEQLSLKDSRRVYVRGLVDGMLGTPMDLAVIREGRGRRAVAQLAISYSNGGDAIVARDPLRAMPDLRGRRVAIEQGLGDYFLGRALESAEMSPSDVEVVYLPYALAQEALRAGDVDAIHAYSPILHRLTLEGERHFHVLFTSRETPGEIVDLLIVAPEVAAERAEDLSRFERAYDRACQFLRDEPDRAFEIMADREGVAADEMARSFREDLTLIPAADRAAFLNPGGRAAQAEARFHSMPHAFREDAVPAERTAAAPNG